MIIFFGYEKKTQFILDVWTIKLKKKRVQCHAINEEHSSRLAVLFFFPLVVVVKDIKRGRKTNKEV